MCYQCDILQMICFGGFGVVFFSVVVLLCFCTCSSNLRETDLKSNGLVSLVGGFKTIKALILVVLG